MKRLPKLLCWSLLIFLPFYGLAGYLNPWQWFRLDLSQLDLTSTEKQESYHVIGYGVDIERAETFYVNLRTMLGATYVNRKVYIYRANPQYGDGQIGEEPFNGLRYYGAYKQDVITGRDVIVYNGTDETLVHELVHFFYNHMKRAHADEVFAYLTTAYVQVVDQQAKFIEIIKLLAMIKSTPKEVTNV